MQTDSHRSKKIPKRVLLDIVFDYGKTAFISVNIRGDLKPAAGMQTFLLNSRRPLPTVLYYTDRMLRRCPRKRRSYRWRSSVQMEYLEIPEINFK